jgi:hypothetical protein
MYNRSPSSSGGMNSPPSRMTGIAVMARANVLPAAWTKAQTNSKAGR